MRPSSRPSTAGGWCARRWARGRRSRRPALAARGPVSVLVLADVLGDEQTAVATVGSGPFAADPSTFADAAAVLAGVGPTLRLPSAIAAHLARGARGEIADTPKPGDARLA